MADDIQNPEKDTTAELAEYAAQKQAEVDSAVEGAKAAIAKKRDEVSAARAELKALTDELETARTDLLSKKTALNDPASGVGAVLELAAQSLKDGKEKISELQLKAQEDATRASDARTSSQAQLKAIEDSLVEAKRLQAQVAEVLQMVTQTGLAGSFLGQVNELKKERRWWLGGLVLSVIALGVVVLHIYQQQVAHGGFQAWNDWFRFLYASPFIYLTYFCANNFAKVQAALERYRFKGTIAVALNSYMQLWTASFPEPEAKDRLLDFVLESIRKIFREPYQDVSFRRRFTFNVGYNKILAAGAEVHQEHETPEKDEKKVV